MLQSAICRFFSIADEPPTALDLSRRTSPKGATFSGLVAVVLILAPAAYAGWRGAQRWNTRTARIWRAARITNVSCAVRFVWPRSL